MQKILPLLILALLFSGCSLTGVKDGPPAQPLDPNSIPELIPFYEPISAKGNMPEYERFGKVYKVQRERKPFFEEGLGSWYGSKFHGRETSNGEIYDMAQVSAAHPTLPIPSFVRVTNIENNRQIIVRVNDRGPFHENRIIDLSYAAALKLGYAASGTARVRVEAILIPPPNAPPVVSPDQPAPAVVVAAPILSRSSALPVPVAIADDTVPAPPLPPAEIVVAAPPELNSPKMEPPKTAPPPSPEPVIESVTDSEGAGTYLQLGTYSSVVSAEQQRQEIEDKLKQPVVVTPFAARDNKLLYRVRLGPLKDREAATALLPSLTALGIKNPQIVTIK